MISKNEIKRIKQLELKKFRQRENLFVAEGPKVVGDLLKCGLKPNTLIATDEWDLIEAYQDVQRIPKDELRKISFMQHPQQVVAVFPIPQHPTPVPEGLCLALDGVQDPGNLGTIIRIADWFGIKDIYCSTDTADAWNPKVVQATMGSIARVKIHYVDLEQIITESPLPVYATQLDGNNIFQQELSDEGIIVMGNEGNGISQPIRKLIAKKLFIPSYTTGDTAESLNVAIATAIVCAEFRRR